MLGDNDRARTADVKHSYGADPADPRLYHLVIDTTSPAVPATVELIVVAARAVWAAGRRRARDVTYP